MRIAHFRMFLINTDTMDFQLSERGLYTLRILRNLCLEKGFLCPMSKDKRHTKLIFKMDEVRI
jgi:hypothetical protein